MPRIAAFRGVRYDVGHVGSLEGVVCPTADRIDATLQKELYERHPANAVRLVKNRDELGDEAGATHARAARFFRNWQREGVLQREPDPAIYVYHQVDVAKQHLQRGFICLLDVDGEDCIAPSEETVAADRIADRLQRLRTVEGNLTSVVGVFSSLQSEPQDLLEQSIVNLAPIETRDTQGVIHRVWPLTQIEVINDATSATAETRVAILSGLDDYFAAMRWLAESDSLAEADRRSQLMVCLLESDSFDPIDERTIEDISIPTVPGGMVFHSHNAK